MADTVVIPDAEEDGGTAAESAREAAVAEGAAQVRLEQAEEAANEAEAAAEVALEAAKANIEAGGAVAEATMAAEGAAQQATVSAEMVHEALQAQTAAIAALTEELKASHKQQMPAEQTKTAPKTDKPPGQQSHWYYKKLF
jgi:hypothetical protein